MQRIKIATALGLLPALSFAQDLSGTWQGTLHVAQQDLRLVIEIVKKDTSPYAAFLYSIDQSPDPVPFTSVGLEGSNLKLTIELVRASYEGRLSRYGNSIAGTWKQSTETPLELNRATKETAWQIDPSPHTVQFVTVDKDVKLEVLDWGGSGRPLILLSGLGDRAHVFDKFAPKLTASYHVYGITRRGFGASSHPDEGYSADRLGDDVLAVMDAFKLDRPVLVGHSIAGEELSSVGSRYPEKVAGLVYLDAGYPYAYYDPASAKLFEELQPSSGAPGPARLILEGTQKYTQILAPILAIFAAPPDLAGSPLPPGTDRAAFEKTANALSDSQTTAFEKGLPKARVVRIAHANHYVFRSNEADVLREMNSFIAGLPPAK